MPILPLNLPAHYPKGRLVNNRRTFHLLVFLFILISFPAPSIAQSLGCNYPNNLEITVINVGQADATLIATPTKLMLIDAGESYWNSNKDALKISSVIKEKYGSSCDTIDFVLITHIHLDHTGYVTGDEDSNDQLLNSSGGLFQDGDSLLNPKFYGGLSYLTKTLGYKVGITYSRDYRTHNPNLLPEDGGSKTSRNWRAYLSSPDGKATLNPRTAVLGKSQIELGSINGLPVIFDIVIVDGKTPSNQTGCSPSRYFRGPDDVIWGDLSNTEYPPSENGLSIGSIISIGNFQMFIAGDLSGENYRSQYGYQYHDLETCLAEDSYIRKCYGRHLEVLRANHHGSSHSSNQFFIQAFNPKTAIFSVGDHNTYGHVDPEVLDRMLYKVVELNKGTVFMTECGDNVFSPSDVCHSKMTNLCATVVDGEFPTATESGEIGDRNVEIVVSSDGQYFVINGTEYKSSKAKIAMPWLQLLLDD